MGFYPIFAPLPTLNAVAGADPHHGFPCDKLEGAVAQLVEQRTENPCVGGSIPPHTTNWLRV